MSKIFLEAKDSTLENPKYQSLSLAEIWQAGARAEYDITEGLFEYFSKFNENLEWFKNITTDYCDNSLEVHMDEQHLPDWLADEEFFNLVKSYGFSQFWINWPDKTEQYCLNLRKPKYDENILK